MGLNEEENRESIFPDVIFQIRPPSEPETTCLICKQNPAIREAVYRRVHIPCCYQEECRTKAAAEAREMAQKDPRAAEFELAKRQRKTQ